MTYLNCNHCSHPNEVKSEYLTFCEQCGKKIANNFKDWSKEHPDKSFDDFKAMVCRSSILHWELENQEVSKKKAALPNVLYILGGAILLTLAVLWGTYRGPEVAGKLEDWALRKIQFRNSDTDLWITSIIQEGNFQIMFPSDPEKVTESSESAMGTIEHYTYRVEPEVGTDDNLAYAVTCMTYPPAMINSRVISNEQVDQFLKYTIEGLEKRSGSKLISEKTIAYGLFPGKEIRMDYENGLAEIKCRLYLVKNTLYALKVTSATQKRENKARDFFLNSFKLLEYANASKP